MPAAGAKWTGEAETAMLLAAIGDNPPSSMNWDQIRDAVGAVTGSRPTFEAARQHLAAMRRKVSNGPTEGGKSQENAPNKSKTSKSSLSGKAATAKGNGDADDATSLIMSGGGRKRKAGVKADTEDPEVTPKKPKRARKPKAKKEGQVKMEDIKDEPAHDGDTTVSEDLEDVGGLM